MRFRGILAAVLLASAAPALAAVHHPFAVVDAGGALVTRYPLVPGEVITCGGVAHTVWTSRADHGSFLVTVVPSLGGSAVCST